MVLFHQQVLVVMVIVIEMGQPVVRLLAWVLTEARYDVIAAKRLDDALALTPITPTVIVVNADLPPGPKRALVQSARERCPMARILDVCPEPATDADSGADGYLRIPFDADDLVAEVDVLSGQSPP